MGAIHELGPHNPTPRIMQRWRRHVHPENNVPTSVRVGTPRAASIQAAVYPSAEQAVGAARLRQRRGCVVMAIFTTNIVKLLGVRCVSALDGLRISRTWRGRSGCGQTLQGKEGLSNRGCKGA